MAVKDERIDLEELREKVDLAWVAYMEVLAAPLFNGEAIDQKWREYKKLSAEFKEKRLTKG